ncbi:hypothetical protein DL767_006954 [Monosporascus sp. MG133]|nr:hypothetical protein DL767_006954 [Monosporascus sp. MG133]
MAQSSAELSLYGRGVVEAAFFDGLSTDLSNFDPHPVRRNLKPNSKSAYTREMEIWNAYLATFPERDPRDMRVMKHFAEVISRGIKARLKAKVGRGETKKGRATTFSVRNKMRRFYNMWEREMHIDIPEERSSMPRPEHPLAERLEGPDGLPPPLFAQPMLHWLINIISARAFRDYRTIEDVLSVIPEEGESFCFLDWADDMLDKPVFPEWSESGPRNKAKNDKAWGNQVLQWAKRAGFINGLAIHAIRREILIKVNDSGALMGQVA